MVKGKQTYRPQEMWTVILDMTFVTLISFSFVHILLPSWQNCCTACVLDVFDHITHLRDLMSFILGFIGSFKAVVMDTLSVI